MLSPIRKDKFNISSNINPGFYRATFKYDTESYFLDVVVVQPSNILPDIKNVISSTELYETIAEGDIILVGNKNNVRVVLSQRANHNTLLVTEKCDNRCSFCSQPPNEEDDDWLYVQAGLAIAEFQSDGVVGISGGEPLLNKKKFLNFVKFVNKFSPRTKLHILTNGRALSDKKFANELSLLSEKITLGIPLYSAISRTHDELVGSQDAFKQTIAGLINAGNLGIAIEIRFIPTQKNYMDLKFVVDLTARCFSNIVQISVMNLEPMGWAKNNWLKLYLEPSQYEEELAKSVAIADNSSLDIVLFNYPLCFLLPSARAKAVKSISDWKNYFPESCKLCKLKTECTGFFTSSKGMFHQSPEPIM